MQTLQCIFFTVFIGFIIIIGRHQSCLVIKPATCIRPATSHLHLDTQTSDTILRTSSGAGDTQGGNEHVSFVFTFDHPY